MCFREFSYAKVWICEHRAENATKIFSFLFCGVWRGLHTLASSAVYVISQLCLHGGFASQMQTLLPGTSETGNDRGLVFILRPEQTMCTWYLETKDAKPVQNVAIPLSYSERGNFPSSSVEYELCLWKPKENYPGKVVYYNCSLFNQSVLV